ncbi:flagellar basal body-associated FliL family protein [Roseomonas sp. E05]|uniref:flagellar basal body-associated FliL family protein n=1 Tax=Roseomonas sp. E05 TaxID=3046310 RepID=UPI0024BA66B0|nr:flagellar basal body-associated FliL family protein [Roseomonas sp. E05]MDJ0390390.1 flagellar basal body-associated FliL family protein [Roseomonas sp. E05]
MTFPSFRRAMLGAAAAVMMVPAVLSSALPARAEEAPKKEFEYVTLGDFTVNLPSSSRRMSYVVVSVTLETKSAQTQQFRDLSPRLKQAVLQRLMAMSVRQELRPGRTDPGVLRDNLFDSLAQLQEEGLKDVVITRLLYS